MELPSQLVHLLWPATLQGQLVIALVLLPILALACYILARVYLDLHAERRGLLRCREELARAQEAEDEIGAPQTEGSLADAPLGGLVRRLIGSLWAARELPSPDLEALASMTAQNEVNRLSFPRVAPNLLLLAGLLGTVLGLAGVVASLGPSVGNALSRTSPESIGDALAGTLRPALSYMSSAFACTTWGILSAIGVALATRQVSRKQEALLGEALEFGFSRFVPAVFPKRQELQIRELERALRAGRTFLGQLPERMREAAGEFERMLQRAGQTMDASIGQLQSVSEGMQKTLTEVAGDVREGAEGLLLSTKAVKESADQLRLYHQDLRNAYIEVRRIFDESQAEAQKQGAGHLDAIRELQDEFGRSADRILAGAQDAAQRLAESTHAFGEAGRRFTETGDAITDRLDRGFELTTEGIRGMLAGHERTIEQVESVLRAIAERLDDLAQRLDPRLLPADQWSRFTQQLARVADALEEAARGLCPPAIPVESAIRTLVEAAGRIASEVGTVNQLLQRLEGQLAALSAGLRGTATTTELREIRDILSRQNDLLSGLCDSLTQKDRGPTKRSRSVLRMLFRI